MRVRINEKLRVFHGHVPHDLNKGQEVSGSLAEMLLTRAGKKVTRIDDGGEEVAPEPPADQELDIDAGVGKILAWVGEDSERAAEALAAEQAKEKPRPTLVKALEQLLDEDED